MGISDAGETDAAHDDQVVYLTWFGLGCLAAAMGVLSWYDRHDGAAIDIGFWQSYTPTVDEAAPYACVFALAFALCSLRWLRVARRHPLAHVFALTVILEVGLACCGVVWAFEDMFAGFWPGLDQFVGNCFEAATDNMLAATLLLAMQQPGLLVAYYVPGTALHRLAIQRLVPGLEAGSEVESGTV